jgi:hypothetical protein
MNRTLECWPGVPADDKFNEFTGSVPFLPAAAGWKAWLTGIVLAARSGMPAETGTISRGRAWRDIDYI